MKILTVQEENVMQIIWQLKECAIKDVVMSMPKPQPPYTTIASVIKNLEKKGYVTKRRFGNVKVYKPKISTGEYKKHFLHEVVENYFENSYSELVNFFVKEKKLDKKELEEIIRLIEKDK